MAARRKNAKKRPDDGRMYGMSDAGYQGKLKLLTKRQRALNDQVNADRRKNDAALFVQGTEATDNTTSQAACCKELLFLIQHHPRVKGVKKPLPIVIAVEQWSAGMMGRAAKAVNETLGTLVSDAATCNIATRIVLGPAKVSVGCGTDTCSSQHSSL